MKWKLVTKPETTLVVAIVTSIEPISPSKSIPIPSNENLEVVQLINDKLLERLVYLKGFFSKSISNKLPNYYGSGNDMELELEKPLPAITPPTYSCPPHLLL